MCSDAACLLRLWYHTVGLLTLLSHLFKKFIPFAVMGRVHNGRKKSPPYMSICGYLSSAVLQYFVCTVAQTKNPPLCSPVAAYTLLPISFDAQLSGSYIIKGEKSRRLSFLQMTAMEVTAVVILRLLRADVRSSGLSAGLWHFSGSDSPLHS